MKPFSAAIVLVIIVIQAVMLEKANENAKDWQRIAHSFENSATNAIRECHIAQDLCQRAINAANHLTP